MPGTAGELTGELYVIETVIDSLLASNNMQDFCRALVHSEISGHEAQGSQVFLLNGDSALHPVASYGGSLIQAAEPVSIWGDGTLGRSIREKAPVLGPCPSEPSCHLLAIPMMKDQIPMGVLTLNFGKKISGSPLEKGPAMIIGKIGAVYLETVGAQSVVANGKVVGSPDDLTSRQVAILGFMADGMVNAEIARELLLSESTIRQETVKIYRALGVPGRLEATKKAKSLGLIGRRLVAPPPHSIVV